MARAPAGHAMGGGTTYKSVKIRPEWQWIIEEEKATDRAHFNARIWTEEENAFLLQSRELGISWNKICQAIGCNEGTARKQWRKLTTK